ncbi:helix-turn-helix transcriptional regulator [Bacillus suaedae]|uniref:Helix-turn-helix transcriptional regulator n=1 Tax=Halalkalibacter suaedae TaxID=2822140 RepID=A0A941ARZ8_9BACI|nr:helix-turn-helix transcriptional regulator [Bacillus suaedae]MBP3953623.1 helix-turn-helix transcriptional regulator [Bacillus suaedae]
MKIKVKDYEKFNVLLLRKGFSKTEFSKVIGLSQTMMVQLTNGSRNPSPKTAKKITEVLEIDFDEIFVIDAGGEKVGC